jgi:Domain of unknown function (DUF4214)
MIRQSRKSLSLRFGQARRPRTQRISPRRGRELGQQSLEPRLALSSTPDQNADFVMGAYHDLLSRSAGPSELSYWTNQLDSGVSLGTVANVIDHSSEFLDHTISQLYETFLGRSPDAGGLNFFAGQVQASRMTVPQIEIMLASSAEMYQESGASAAGWIDALYEDVLGRAADPGGLSHWTAVLAQTADLLMIAENLIASPEANQRQVQNDYSNLLARAPDQQGLDYWM